MGFQYHKKTKRKKSKSGNTSAWGNVSASKRGVGVSGSIKHKRLTYNTGDLFGKRGSRTTFNFGNGLRYVHYGKKGQSLINCLFSGILFILVMILAQCGEQNNTTESNIHNEQQIIQESEFNTETYNEFIEAVDQEIIEEPKVLDSNEVKHERTYNVRWGD